MSWLKDCEICNTGLCKTVDELKVSGMSENSACKQMSDESKGLYSKEAIRGRYLWHTGKVKRKVVDSQQPEESGPEKPHKDVVKLYNMIESIRKFLLKKDVYWDWQQEEVPAHINSEEAIIAWKAQDLMHKVYIDSDRYLKGLIPPKPEIIIPPAPDITSKDFETTVLKSELPSLIMFTEDGCRPCREISPRIDKLSLEYKNRIKVYKCYPEQGESIFSEYDIEATPQLILFKDGKAHWIDEGIRTKTDIKKEVTKILKRESKP